MFTCFMTKSLNNFFQKTVFVGSLDCFMNKDMIFGFGHPALSDRLLFKFDSKRIYSKRLHYISTILCKKSKPQKIYFFMNVENGGVSSLLFFTHRLGILHLLQLPPLLRLSPPLPPPLRPPTTTTTTTTTITTTTTTQHPTPQLLLSL